LQPAGVQVEPVFINNAIADGIAIVAGRDAPEVFQSAEHALDSVAVAIQEMARSSFSTLIFPLLFAFGVMFGIAPRVRRQRL